MLLSGSPGGGGLRPAHLEAGRTWFLEFVGLRSRFLAGCQLSAVPASWGHRIPGSCVLPPSPSQQGRVTPSHLSALAFSCRPSPSQGRGSAFKDSWG